MQPLINWSCTSKTRGGFSSIPSHIACSINRQKTDLLSYYSSLSVPLSCIHRWHLNSLFSLYNLNVFCCCIYLLSIWSKDFIYEPKVLLKCSQEPVMYPYTEPDDCSLHSSTQIEIFFSIIIRIIWYQFLSLPLHFRAFEYDKKSPDIYGTSEELITGPCLEPVESSLNYRPILQFILIFSHLLLCPLICY